MVKVFKARIRDTEFELVNRYHDPEDQAYNMISWRPDGPYGRVMSVPADWVEFYEPERDEPLEKDRAELDTQSNVWQRFPNGYWYRAGAEANADGSPGHGLTWYGLQKSTKYGPTRPMALKEES